MQPRRFQIVLYLHKCSAATEPFDRSEPIQFNGNNNINNNNKFVFVFLPLAFWCSWNDQLLQNGGGMLQRNRIPVARGLFNKIRFCCDCIDGRIFNWNWISAFINLFNNDGWFLYFIYFEKKKKKIQTQIQTQGDLTTWNWMATGRFRFKKKKKKKKKKIPADEIEIQMVN